MFTDQVNNIRPGFPTAIPKGMIIGTKGNFVVLVRFAGEKTGYLAQARHLHFSAADFPGGLADIEGRIKDQLT